MLQQFVAQLKQTYPSIQDIRIPGESTLSATTAADKEEVPAQAAEAPADAEAPTAEEASESTEEPATSEASATSEAAAEDSAAQEDSAELEGASLSMVIVIRQYQLKKVNALLTDIGVWAQKHKCQVTPVILTSKETEQLQGFTFSDTELTPEQIVESYRAREGYPSNARRHIVVALEEIQRLLRNLEQDYPTTGQHAVNNGQYIQSLFVELTRWGATIFHKPYTAPEDIWAFLLQQFPGHKYLSQPDVAHFPLRLKAFIQRHKALAPLATQTFDNNDLEIERLSQPLLSMARALRTEATRRLTPIAERRERNRKRMMAAAFGITSVVAVALAVWWILRPPVLTSVTLPQGSQPGGIVGNYYGGQNFNRYLNKRTDRGINMHWRASPLHKVPADYYSVRWSGFIEAPHPGKYRICSQYDDGVQLRIGNKELINDWNVGGARTKCKVVYLEKGWHNLHMQMFEARGNAVVKLSWEHPKRKGIHPVPAKHLCCQK